MIHKEYGSLFKVPMLFLFKVPLFLQSVMINQQCLHFLSLCIIFFSNFSRNLPDDSVALVTGWGRVTNNNTAARKDLRKYKVATRTLLKALIPIANDHEGCEIYKIDKEKQICAGGVIGKTFNIMDKVRDLCRHILICKSSGACITVSENPKRR